MLKSVLGNKHLKLIMSDERLNFSHAVSFLYGIVLVVISNYSLLFYFSIIITMYIDSLVTNILKIKVNKTRQHRTQNLQ